MYGVSSPLSLLFLQGQLQYLTERGFEVHVFSSPGAALEELRWQGVHSHPIEIRRDIVPARDLLSLYRLWRLMKTVRPEVVNVSTPKAGLLGGLASALTRVPCRIYLLRGLRLETATGFKRKLLYGCEWLACRCAHRLVSVSKGLSQRFVDLGLADPGKIVVLASGSSNGVVARRFCPTPETTAQAIQLRRDLQIPEDAPVAGFVGRLTRDKGVGELFSAYQSLRRRHPELRLLLLGDFEQGDPIPRELREQIERDPNVIRPGFVADVAPYYHLMDFLVLPTYREGFPNACLEAQAAGVPVVTTTATGAIDSVLGGKTGFLVSMGDAAAIAEAAARLLDDPLLRKQMGNAGREWVTREFEPGRIWQALRNEYELLLAESRYRRELRQRGWRLLVKSCLDRSAAALGLLLLSPVLLVCALLVRFGLGHPILFRQSRPGFRGRPFTLLKFRTMSDARGADGNLLPDDRRLTRIGRLLRSLSLDELPQLWNVFRGDMSLVGPRPLLQEYLERYTPQQARRHDVLPGITGWAQVRGRNSLSWEEKFSLDIWYVDNWSLGLDLRILLKTVMQVVKRRGISQAGHVTMPQFTGSPRQSPTGDAS